MTPNEQQDPLCTTPNWAQDEWPGRNFMHLAHMLKASGGIPGHGNQRSAWSGGCRFEHPNPAYR